ncbi:hypothetical protein J2Z60_001700 [Lactobacillus colini]|uniref:Neutral/alkaline non-lysosomal ceramidase N-terminal domain-containing protein n=1 Tax=Lactobacillus colini TaxID=1819254 RepID=A0ABS4MFP9_9LACO|nr:neutral/alkaline non-lysosomal ceramidase N-terminal domain-containing protein [Lactobacillus colini]MBP2058515.1 hypothetical protein [Lactobacillus colini]
MFVGHGRKDITPHKPFYLLGYKTLKRNKPAEGIHDHIFINGILFDNSKGQKVFIATGDLLEIEDIVAADIRQRISKKFDIPFENIIIGVTHDHHSVRDYHRTWEFGKYSQDYYDFFVQSFVDVYQECLLSLTDVEIKYGDDLVVGYYSNRNHKGKLSDNIVSVLKFIHDGKGVAGIVNLAVHSTVLSGENMLLTADLAGNLCTKLKEKWGFYPLMLIGCAGDSSNHFDRKGRDFKELDRVTTGLAEKIAPIKTSETVDTDNLDVQVLTQSQEVINDKKSYDADLKNRIQGMKDGTISSVGSQPINALIEKCEEQLEQPQFFDVIQMEIIDIGNLRIFVFPGELASAGAKVLRQSTDKTVLIAGYSNGFHYYFLQAQDYGLSFETIGNPVPKGTFEEIISKFVYGSHVLDAYEK